MFFFFFNDTATTEIYTLSLHDALPILPDRTEANPNELNQDDARYGFRCCIILIKLDRKSGSAGMPRPISYAVFCLKKKQRSDIWMLRMPCREHEEYCHGRIVLSCRWIA